MFVVQNAHAQTRPRFLWQLFLVMSEMAQRRHRLQLQARLDQRVLNVKLNGRKGAEQRQLSVEV